MITSADSSEFDLDTVDGLLSTTRAVRKRLDLDRGVSDDVLLECIALSQQAPTGSNMQNWRWVIVRDPDKKLAIADAYRSFGRDYLAAGAEQAGDDQTKRVLTSAVYLADNLERVPVHVIPCVRGQMPQTAGVAEWSGMMGSIYPAVWSFQLALRSRGLGSCLTTLHLAQAGQISKLLELPDDVMQIALLPVAHTLGTEFKPAARRPPEHITHVDTWGNKPVRG